MLSSLGLLSVGVVLIGIGLGCLLATWLWSRRVPETAEDISHPKKSIQAKQDPPMGEPITPLGNEDSAILPTTALDDEDDEDDEDVYVALEEDYARRLEKHVMPSQEPSEVQSNSEDQEGYEFLTGNDAIRVKLDLARAYLEMGDYGAVQETLELVFNEGKEAERHEADLLLEQAKLAAED